MILCLSIGPSTTVVFKPRTSLAAHPLFPHTNSRFNLRVKGKPILLSPTHQDVNQTAEKGVADERGRQRSFTQAAPNELKLGEGG